jgi:hypothetical protein
VGGGIFIWIAGKYSNIMRSVLGFIPLLGMGGSSFTGGLLFIISGALTAFFILVLSHFISEQIIIFARIAFNLKIVRQIGVQFYKKQLKTTPPAQTPGGSA